MTRVSTDDPGVADHRSGNPAIGDCTNTVDGIGTARKHKGRGSVFRRAVSSLKDR